MRETGSSSMTGFRRLIRDWPHRALMRRWFDAEYYRRSNPDILLPPLLHFIVEGAYEGCNPHPLFDTKFYLEKNLDLAAAGVNPFAHYLMHGFKEGRQPHPWFVPAYYLAQCPEARGTNPLLDFLEDPEQRANPHPLFDCRAHLCAKPKLRGNALVDFLVNGPGPTQEGAQFGQ